MSDIHNRNIENRIKQLENSGYSDKEVEKLKEFKNYLLAENLSVHRIARYLSTFHTLEQYIDFNLLEAEKSDLIELVGRINQDRLNDKDYSVWTKAEFKKGIKKFYGFLEGCNNPEIVEFITIKPKKKDIPLTDPADLPQHKDVRKLEEQAKNPRDQAFIKVLWESGGRISEILNLEWKDFQNDSNPSYLVFRNSKTMKRKIPIKESVKALEEWKEKHPDPSNNSYIFVDLQNGTQISYNGLSGQMDKLEMRAGGLDCKTNFHAFRKGRATFLAKNGLNQAQLCQFMGWVQGSKQAQKYIRMVNTDLEDSIENIWDKKVSA